MRHQCCNAIWGTAKQSIIHQQDEKRKDVRRGGCRRPQRGKSNLNARERIGLLLDRGDFFVTTRNQATTYTIFSGEKCYYH